MATPAIKRVLLLGSSYSAVDFLLQLKRRGLHVSVCGGIKNDPCHAFADESFFVDYSKPELVEEVVRQGQFDYLAPSCNDISYLTGATIAAKYGFKGFDSLVNAEIIHNKRAFRGFTQDRIKVPRTFADLDAAHQFLEQSAKHEVIVKPIDSFSGKGVSRVARAGDLPKAVQLAKESSKMAGTIIEEFVQGRLHSHSAFLKDQSVALDFFVDEYCLVYPYQVDASNHPSAIASHLRTRVRTEINKMAKMLNLTDGLLHTQFIADDEDFWIIECMRRCPGDLYYNLIKYSTGIEYVDWFLKGFIGEDYTVEKNEVPAKPVIRHTVSSNEDLMFSNYLALIENRQMHNFPLKLTGEKLKAAPFDKAGIIFIQAENDAEMFDWTPRLNELFKVNRF